MVHAARSFQLDMRGMPASVLRKRLTCSASSFASLSEASVLVREGTRGWLPDVVLRAAKGAADAPTDPSPLAELGVLLPTCVLRLDGRLLSGLAHAYNIVQLNACQAFAWHGELSGTCLDKLSLLRHILDPSKCMADS